MKNTLIILMFLGLLSNCNQSENADNKDAIVKRKMDIILENLENKYPNYKENQIVRGNMQKELDKTIDSIYKLNYLDDIPMRVFKIGKNPHGKGALIQFHTDNYLSETRNLLSDRLEFDIIGLMDEQKASLLKDDKTYLISGKMLKRLNETEVFLIVPKVYFSPETEISKDGNYRSAIFTYKIGDLLMEIDSAKLINRYAKLKNK